MLPRKLVNRSALGVVSSSDKKLFLFISDFSLRPPAADVFEVNKGRPKGLGLESQKSPAKRANRTRYNSEKLVPLKI